MTVTEAAILGKTDREVERLRESEVNSRRAFEHRWQLIWEFDGGTEAVCRLFDAIEASKLANARQIVIDWDNGSHFIALTDCPLAALHIKPRLHK